MKAMLLAAGLGTRLRPVTDVFAKPAVPFLNIPLLYYPVVLMQEAGATELVVNTHYKPEQIAELTSSIAGFKGQIHLSPEVEKPLGSGGGVWAARKWLSGSGDFIVANGDEVIVPSTPEVLQKFVRTHKQTDALATIFVMRHPGVGTQFGGVWTDKSGLVHGFGKQSPQGRTDLEGLHYIGLLMLSDRVFQYLPDGESNLLYDALMGGIARGERVQTFIDTCTWFETGNSADFLEAINEILHTDAQSKEMHLLKEMGQRFWGHGLQAMTTISGAPVVRGTNTQISSDVQVKGFAVIGDDCKVGRSCVLDEVILMPGAELADGTRAHRQIILPKY